MPVNVKRITLGNATFSLNALYVNPNKYLPLMAPHFTVNQFKQKANESEDNYLRRIFNALYNKLNATDTTATAHGPVTRIPLSEGCEKILNALGIEIVKKCPKRSSVLFKHSGTRYRMNNEEMNRLFDSIHNKTNLKRRHHPKIQIGVEMEFIGDRNKVNAFNGEMYNLVGEDRYNPEMCYNKNKGDKWVLGTDGSLRYSGSGQRGFELTSPILNINSKKDMEELRKVTELVKTVLNGKTNASCGTHIHMSFPVKCATDELVMHFARSYRKSEDSLFDKVVPANRRGNKAYYSKTVSLNYLWDRYRKLNFNNVKKDTTNIT